MGPARTPQDLHTEASIVTCHRMGSISLPYDHFLSSSSPTENNPSTTPSLLRSSCWEFPCSCPRGPGLLGPMPSQKVLSPWPQVLLRSPVFVKLTLQVPRCPLRPPRARGAGHTSLLVPQNLAARHHRDAHKQPRVGHLRGAGLRTSSEQSPRLRCEQKTQAGVMGKGGPRKLRGRPWDSPHCVGGLPQRWGFRIMGGAA